jgi:hypothetical protein
MDREKYLKAGLITSLVCVILGLIQLLTLLMHLKLLGLFLAQFAIALLTAGIFAKSAILKHSSWHLPAIWIIIAALQIIIVAL